MIKLARSGDVTEAVTEDGVWQYYTPPTPQDNTVTTRINESRWSFFIGPYIGGNYCEIRPTMGSWVWRIFRIIHSSALCGVITLPLFWLVKRVVTRSVETKFVIGTPICKCVTHSLTHSGVDTLRN